MRDSISVTVALLENKNTVFVNACEFLYGVVMALSVDSSITMFLMNCVDVLCREKIVGTRFYSYRKHRPDASAEVVTPISISSEPFFKLGTLITTPSCSLFSFVVYFLWRN